MNPDPREHRLTFSQYLVLLAVAIFAAIGDFLLKSGMNKMPAIGIGNLQQSFLAVFTPTIALGICCLVVFFAGYLTALSWADLTFVLPATGLGYVFMALLARFVLHEEVSVARWLGILLITAGVGFVANQPHKSTKPTEGLHL